MSKSILMAGFLAIVAAGCGETNSGAPRTGGTGPSDGGWRLVPPLSIHEEQGPRSLADLTRYAIWRATGLRRSEWGGLCSCTGRHCRTPAKNRRSRSRAGPRLREVGPRERRLCAHAQPRGREDVSRGLQSRAETGRGRCQRCQSGERQELKKVRRDLVGRRESSLDGLGRGSRRPFGRSRASRT